MTTPTGPTILDQPWQIELYRLHAMKHALRLEIQTGMKMSRGVSVMKLANDTMLRNGHIDRPHRTKVKTLHALDGYIAKKEQEAMGL